MRRSALAVIAIGALALTGCTTASPPTVGDTVAVEASYGEYDEAGLVDGAALIVEAEVISAVSTVLLPLAEGEDTTPELSDAEQKAAVESGEGIAVTTVTLRADVVHRGDLDSGDDLTVIQAGGTIAGVTYQVTGEVMLVPGEQYLLFAGNSRDGAYFVLGGSAGIFVADGAGTFDAASPDAAPFERLTSAEVAELVGS